MGSFSYERDHGSALSVPRMSTVELMADAPFGFSSGEDPDRDKRGKNDAGSGSGANPLGPFGMGGEFDMADLGQIFTRLGQMFGSAGSAMTGQSSGPVHYALARQVASSSMGFIAPLAETPNSAIADAVRRSGTWVHVLTTRPSG